jgi:hypothetical protein
MKKNKRNTNGVGPSGTRISEEEPKDLERGKDNLKREVGGETCIKTNFRTNKIYCVRS